MGERERRLGEVVITYLQAAEAGRHLGRRQLLDDHPDLGEDLAAFFEGRDHLQRLAAPLQKADTPAPPGCGKAEGEENPELMTLGDFRLVREMGRGGMGIV